MTSTNTASFIAPSPTFWRSAGLRFHSYNHYLKGHFGCRVQKVSVDAGFTCPNVDGTVARGGCTFCSNRSFSPSRRVPRQAILEQIDDGIRRLKHRYDCDTFLAYFQPATNTHGSIERLRDVYNAALEHPRVVGMAVGTRPDCADDAVLDLLQAYASETYVSVEYGIQTIHDPSLQWMNRGHRYDIVPDVVQRSRNRGFAVCAHVMLGLPGETHEDMLDTAREMARLRLNAIKIHNLYAVKNTPLAQQVQSGEVSLIDRDRYIRAVVEFLELLPPEMIIERISGDAPRDFLVGPPWCLDKSDVLRAIDTEMTRRDTWQGKRWSASP